MSGGEAAWRQWPDNIVAGDIRYGKASNYDGFYLADVEHGIPTFGSVTETASPTIRGQHVTVFNYPGQTEAIAAELVRRWNAHNDLLAAVKALDAYWTVDFPDGPDGDVEYKAGLGGVLADDTVQLWKATRAAIAKAEGRTNA